MLGNLDSFVENRSNLSFNTNLIFVRGGRTQFFFIHLLSIRPEKFGLVIPHYFSAIGVDVGRGGV